MRSLLAEHAKNGTSIDELAHTLDIEHIAEHLYTKGQPDPDLIIRTSGEQRLSGFLMWQSAHSEFYFCEALWPDFRKVDFIRALRSYGQRSVASVADADERPCRLRLPGIDFPGEWAASQPGTRPSGRGRARARSREAPDVRRQPHPRQSAVVGAQGDRGQPDRHIAGVVRLLHLRTAAALVFNEIFFPTFEPLVGTLLAFTTYAVGFVARPLGGWSSATTVTGSAARTSWS